jgi:hypothetical protein
LPYVASQEWPVRSSDTAERSPPNHRLVADQTIYWTRLDCHDLIADTNLSVSINHADGWLSWYVRGMEFSWLREECTLDFAYDNVLYDNSDFPLKTVSAHKSEADKCCAINFSMQPRIRPSKSLP